ncbi:hypothetical protein [uncultured Bacteroides sp.]|uniref:hypothetical protein n=1 Tax=uncultured Bacteroides sp. TaxID=162156 RepID=UPI002623B573|nr:hypothetical protein [uncultured Bacteroides sp.]
MEVKQPDGEPPIRLVKFQLMTGAIMFLRYTTVDIFFSLIRLGLGISLSLSFKEITDKEWSEILNMAHKQTMLGIVMDAIDRLPDDVSRPPMRCSCQRVVRKRIRL